MQIYQFDFIGSNRNPAGNNGEGRKRELKNTILLPAIEKKSLYFNRFFCFEFLLLQELISLSFI